MGSRDRGNIVLERCQVGPLYLTRKQNTKHSMRSAENAFLVNTQSKAGTGGVQTREGATVLVLGKSGSQTVMFFSEEVVWGTKYAEKNKCTLIRKILLLSGQTLQINMKIKKKIKAHSPPVLKGGATCCMHIYVKAGTRQAERGSGVTG